MSNKPHACYPCSHYTRNGELVYCELKRKGFPFQLCKSFNGEAGTDFVELSDKDKKLMGGVANERH